MIKPPDKTGWYWIFTGCHNADSDGWEIAYWNGKKWEVKEREVMYSAKPIHDGWYWIYHDGFWEVAHWEDNMWATILDDREARHERMKIERIGNVRIHPRTRYIF